jgi:succinate dehydrogenase/fumarate reductase flavoprotein subunit
MSDYDLVVVGSGFAGSMATLNFLETCKKANRSGRVALIEAGRSDERWTMAYLRLDKNLAFDEDWKHEMKAVSRGEADQEYCEKLGQEAQTTALYLQDHGVKFNHHDEENVLLEFKTGQHFVFPEGGGKAIIDNLMEYIQGYKNCDVHWETEGLHLLTNKNGSVRGLQVRKKDGLLHELTAPNV